MEQNKKVDPKIKGIKFVMDNGEEKYTKMMQALMDVIRFKMFNGADARF